MSPDTLVQVPVLMSVAERDAVRKRAGHSTVANFIRGLLGLEPRKPGRKPAEPLPAPKPAARRQKRPT